MLTDLKLHLFHKLYLHTDSEEAQLCALALLPHHVAFVTASVVRVKELICLMILWFKTSFASLTEENKYVTSTWAPCESVSFQVPLFILSGPTSSFLGRQKGYTHIYILSHTYIFFHFIYMYIYIYICEKEHTRAAIE